MLAIIHFAESSCCEDIGPGLLRRIERATWGRASERVVEEAVKSYRVGCERDESGWWVATVRGVRGCHTQERTVDESRRRKKADNEDRRAARAARRAVQLLRTGRLNMSARDAARLSGLSHQRVQQLTQAAAEARSTGRTL